MENQTQIYLEPTKSCLTSVNFPNPVRLNFTSLQGEKSMPYKDTANDLNSKIEKIKLMLQELNPELLKSCEEIPESLRDEKQQEILITYLRTYYASLNSILNEYKLANYSKKRA